MNSSKKITVTGTGSFLPRHVLTNHDLTRMMDTNDEWIRRTYGIAERRVVDDATNVSDLGCEAARRAMDAAGADPSDIDVLIHASLQADYTAPATACVLQSRLGIPSCVAFDMNVGGCSNTAFALTTAINFLANGDCRRALVVCTEIYSKFINWNYRDSSCFLGDGSGAVVLEVCEQAHEIQTDLHTLGGDYERVVWAGRGTVTAPEELRTPVIDGRAVWTFGTSAVPETVATVASKAQLDPSDVDFLIFHQANARMIERNMNTLGIPMSKTFINNSRYGNTGGASSLIALDEAIRASRIHPGDRVLLCSYGAGLGYGSVLFDYDAAHAKTDVLEGAL